jgi:uncharacterized damage-inducible protein DinB
MNEELVKFAGAVRESTLRRLHLVPVGAENWRVDPEAMSFSDTAQHLIDSDQWLYSILQAKASTQMLGKAGIANITDRAQYDALLNSLVRSGDRRISLLSSLTREALNESVNAPEIGGTVTSWWAIVRGNIDHEIHHRGQIAAYLRTLKAARPAQS